MENVEIKVMKVSEDAILPCYAYSTDSGFDLYTSEDYVISAKGTGAIPTGLKFELPEGYGIMVRPRSGNTLKGVNGTFEPIVNEFCFLIDESEHKMDIKVQIGTVDENYRGEIKILTTNNELHPVCIPKGTKLAQGVIEKIPKANFLEVNELSTTDRGEKGFGSTDC